VKLSSRQYKILDFIKKEVQQKGYPPSVREIADAVGLASGSTVHGHLARLEKWGLIRRDPTKPRALQVLNFEIETSKEAEVDEENVPTGDNSILETIIQYTKENKFPPSVRELCKILDVSSTKTIHQQLDLLRAQGLVEWEDKKPRTLRVVKQ
jgi:SOS-response transcriptional repressor LexA